MARGFERAYAILVEAQNCALNGGNCDSSLIVIVIARRV